MLHSGDRGGCVAALYGTVNDLLRYLRAHLGQAPAHLRPALESVRRPRFTVAPNTRIGLAWMLQPMPSGRTLVWHNGATGGFMSFVGWCPDKGTGVAVLTNTAQSVDQVGIAVIEALDAD